MNVASSVPFFLFHYIYEIFSTSVEDIAWSHDLGKSVQRNYLSYPIAKTVAQVMRANVSNLCLYGISCHQMPQCLSSERTVCFF